MGRLNAQAHLHSTHHHASLSVEALSLGQRLQQMRDTTAYASASMTGHFLAPFLWRPLSD
jgi:hypothetical protein